MASTTHSAHMRGIVFNGLASLFLVMGQIMLVSWGWSDDKLPLHSLGERVLSESVVDEGSGLPDAAVPERSGEAPLQTTSTLSPKDFAEETEVLTPAGIMEEWDYAAEARPPLEDSYSAMGDEELVEPSSSGNGSAEALIAPAAGEAN